MTISSPICDLFPLHSSQQWQHSGCCGVQLSHFATHISCDLGESRSGHWRADPRERRPGHTMWTRSDNYYTKVLISDWSQNHLVRSVSENDFGLISKASCKKCFWKWIKGGKYKLLFVESAIIIFVPLYRRAWWTGWQGHQRWPIARVWRLCQQDSFRKKTCPRCVR